MDILELIQRICVMLDIGEPRTLSDVFDPFQPYKQVLISLEDTAKDILTRKDFEFNKETVRLNSDTFREHVYGDGTITTDMFGEVIGDITYPRMTDVSKVGPELGNQSNQILWTRFNLPPTFGRLQHSFKQGYNSETIGAVLQGVNSNTDWLIAAEYGINFIEKFRINVFEKTVDVQDPILFTQETADSPILTSEHIQINVINYSWLVDENGMDVEKIAVDSTNIRAKFDWEILYYGTKAKWLFMKGEVEAPLAQQEYDEKLDIHFGIQRAKRKLIAGGRVRKDKSYGTESIYTYNDIVRGRNT